MEMIVFVEDPVIRYGGEEPRLGTFANCPYRTRLALFSVNLFVHSAFIPSLELITVLAPVHTSTIILYGI